MFLTKICFLARSRRYVDARREGEEIVVFEHICNFTAVTTNNLVHVHSISARGSVDRCAISDLAEIIDCKTLY